MKSKSSQDLLPGVHRAVRGRAVLPATRLGAGCLGGLQAVLQQRKLRGMSVRARCRCAVAALLRVFLSACFGARQSFVSG